MLVRTIEWDGQHGTCAVDKLGPVIIGAATFTVDAGKNGGTDVTWVEHLDITNRFWQPIGKAAGPIAALAAKAGFKVALRRLDSQLRQTTKRFEHRRSQHTTPD